MRTLCYASLLALAVAVAGCGPKLGDPAADRTDDNSYGDGSVSGEADGNDSSGGQGKEPGTAPATE